MTGSRFLSPLGIRLAVAFVAVALAAIAVFAGLTLVSANDEVSTLVSQTHVRDARAAADAAAQAYEEADGWEGADLSSAAALAARGQAELTVADSRGRVLAAPTTEVAEMMARMHGVEILDVPRDAALERPVLVDGTQVGTVELRFPSSHLPGPEREIRRALVRNAWLGAALAAASALAVAVVVARAVSRPINALTMAVQELEGGRRDVRADLDRAPGEIGALAAGFHLDVEHVDLAEEVRAVVDGAESSAAAAELTLDVSLEPTPVVGDPRRLRQLATTLVANALAYTPPGGSIRISTRVARDRAVLEVADDGAGIDPADLPRIFDRFYRGRRTAGSAGSGIGLAIAQELTAAHGGTVRAANGEDGGAVLTVELPTDPSPG